MALVLGVSRLGNQEIVFVSRSCCRAISSSMTFWGGPHKVMASTVSASRSASTTRTTMGTPPTGAMALQVTPASWATGSGGVRSAAKTMAANRLGKALITRFSSVCVCLKGFAENAIAFVRLCANAFDDIAHPLVVFQNPRQFDLLIAALEGHGLHVRDQ